MLIFIVFGLLLPLILLTIASGMACFIVERPRAGAFFIFIAFDLFRRFGYFLSQLAYTNPQNSVTYSLLSSDIGYGIIWGGALFFLAWAWIDQYRTLGGINGLKKSIKTARQDYRGSRNKNLN